MVPYLPSFTIFSQEVSLINEGPLPPGFEIRYTATGERFFVDHNTRTTTVRLNQIIESMRKLGEFGILFIYFAYIAV